MEKETSEFSGIWIPAEVLELKCVSGNEQLLLCYIIGLSNNNRGCYATNRHLAERLGLSRGRISEMISSLFNKGLVTYKISKSEGNKRSIFPNLEGFTGKSVDPFRENGYIYTRKNLNSLRGKAKHNNKIYSKVERKEEREHRALAYLKEFKTKEYYKFYNKYSSMINDFKKFSMLFNNEVDIKDMDLDSVDVIKFMYGYAKGFIKNQRKYEPSNN